MPMFVMWTASIILITMYKVRGYNVSILSNASTLAHTSMKERKVVESLLEKTPNMKHQKYQSNSLSTSFYLKFYEIYCTGKGKRKEKPQDRLW